jgi:hypothetical protein
MKTTIYSLVGKVAVMASLIISVGCLREDDRTIMLNGGNNKEGIPSDDEATENPAIEDPNISIPNIITEVQDKVIRIDMSGILLPKPEGNPNAPHAYLRLYGTGSQEQNVWLSVDDVPKGVSVYNNSDGSQGGEILNDVIFLIDNSDSMDEEADAIARDIVAWAEKLNKSLNVRFAVVGYDGRILGAINFTDYNTIATYLNRTTGVDRTKGFDGADADMLSGLATTYNDKVETKKGKESPMMALHYANEAFSFRENANRVYINFTDEPNATFSTSEFSVEYLTSQENWKPENGTIHTVYSSAKDKYEYTATSERSWLMSDYTGGTVMFVDENFTGVTLDNLPVTGAMMHSYVLKFTNISEFLDGETHDVKVTVMSVDKQVRAERIFHLNFSNF